MSMRDLYFPGITAAELGVAISRAESRYRKNGGHTMKRGTPVFLTGSRKPAAYLTEITPIEVGSALPDVGMRPRA